MAALRHRNKTAIHEVYLRSHQQPPVVFCASVQPAPPSTGAEAWSRYRPVGRYHIFLLGTAAYCFGRMHRLVLFHARTSMTDPPRPSPIIGVVDDDRRILESLQTLLESADYD